MSALATIVGSMGELSESELRQLYLMIGVRLGIPDVPGGAAKPRGTGAGKASNSKPSTAKGRKKAPSSKGNPKRKSQWANHPLYQEYSRLKKVVEAQAKEAKTSFNTVDTAESRAYQQVFSQWLEAKSSFRDHRKDGQSGEAPRDRKQDEEESSEEEEEDEASQPPEQSKTAPPPPNPKDTGKTSGSSGTSGKSRSPPGKGKAPAK
jgi:hypothetical protein